MRLILFFLVTLGASFPAHAGRLDDFYLAQFHLSVSGEPVIAGVSSTPAGASDRCRTWLYHDLKRDWDKLETPTQKVLAKVLPARPALTGESVVQSNAGHFRIHYATSGDDAPPLTDGNGNGIPDWIESVADVFEAVYNREVNDMGYQPPPTPNNQPYDVYLQNLGAARQEFGETVTDAPVTSTSYTSYMVIDNDFSAAEFGNQITPYTPLKALQITAAHEFHHAIQYGYNVFFESWFAEATSTWMEDEVYNSVNQLYSYLPDYIGSTTNTALPLDTPPDVSTGGGYGRWIFDRYLSELFSPSFIRSIWERLKSTPSPGGNADIPMLPFIDQVLQSNGSSLPSVFLGFDRRLLLENWTSHQNEVNLIHPVAAQLESVTNNAFTVPSLTLPRYSFQYYRLRAASATPATLTITYPGKPTTNVAVAFRSTGTGTADQFAADPQTGAITVPSFSSATDVYLLVSNNATGSATFPSEPTQATATPSDATNPFPGSPTLVSSSPSPPPQSSGGGGGGCFIATAAFGSYLHPKVQILRQFRDDYLMKCAPGRAFVHLYYRLSPPVADVIARHETLRALCRVLLLPVIFMVEHLVVGGTLLVLLTVGMVQAGLRCAWARRG